MCLFIILNLQSNLLLIVASHRGHHSSAQLQVAHLTCSFPFKRPNLYSQFILTQTRDVRLSPPVSLIFFSSSSHLIGASATCGIHLARLSERTAQVARQQVAMETTITTTTTTRARAGAKMTTVAKRKEIRVKQVVGGFGGGAE